MPLIHRPKSDPDSIGNKLSVEMERQTLLHQCQLIENPNQREFQALLASVHAHEGIAEKLRAKLAERRLWDRLTGRLRIKQHRVHALLLELVDGFLKVHRNMHHFLSAFSLQSQDASDRMADMTRRIRELEMRIAVLERHGNPPAPAQEQPTRENE